LPGTLIGMACAATDPAAAINKPANTTRSPPRCVAAESPVRDVIACASQVNFMNRSDSRSGFVNPSSTKHWSMPIFAV
jgi:hypothetical protein